MSIDIKKNIKMNEVLTKFGISEKNHEKSHFMLIFGELFVCSLQKQGRFSLFIP